MPNFFTTITQPISFSSDSLRASPEKMKIKSVESHVVHSQDTTTREVHQERNVGGHSGYFVLVHIRTEEGVDGWGECATGSDYGEGAFAAKEVIERSFGPRIVGKDPREFKKLWNLLYLSTEKYGQRDIAILALSGVDIALVDLASKQYGVPASVVLGGCYRNEIPLYASLLFDMDDFEGTASKGKKYVSDHYAGVKYGWGMVPEKPFGKDLKKSEEIVSVIRETLGTEIQLMVDVGRYVNMSSSRALRLAKRISKYDITWLEEPLPRDDEEGYSLLTSQSPIPIAAGEGYRGIQDFKRSILNNQVDLLQPDVSKAGGLSHTKRIVEFAYDFNRSWVPHNWSTAINTAATIQLVASTPDGYLMEYKQEPNPLVQRLIKRSDQIFKINEGKIQVPDSPGLGIEIGENVVDEFSVI
jgi:L-alanine-DL-glutamate epimerase-like enolase superfamily enzyme